MQIKSLSKTNLNVIFKAFNQAFADYEVQLNYEQLESMLIRRGFNPDLSFAAFENDEIISFILNGIGNFNGILTAYDTGTGTLPNYRKQGLATKIFDYSVPHLKDANIKQYLLEVMQHNTNAVSIYKNAGFQIVREFNYFTQKNDAVNNEIKSNNSTFLLKEININEFDFIKDFWDFEPSWQNSFEAISRSALDFIYLGIFIDEKLIGYCIFEPISGDITQIAVSQQNRRRGVATFLLNEIMKLNKKDTIKIINTEISCDSITNFLNAKNISLKGTQFEMIKNII